MYITKVRGLTIGELRVDLNGLAMCVQCACAWYEYRLLLFKAGVLDRNGFIYYETRMSVN